MQSQIAPATRSRTATPLTVNAAFMQEIKEASEELWLLMRKLRHLCSHPQTICLHPRVAVALLQQLQDEIGLYFTLEEYYGYFESPAFVDPELDAQASDLRAQHQAIYVDLCAIVDRAERLLDERQLDALTRHIAVRVDAFFEQLKAHERNEQELLRNLKEHAHVYEDPGGR